MDKYERLKEQVLNELEWAIENTNKYYGTNIPDNITMVDFVGDFKDIPEYQRGILFSYLSIKSMIDILEKGA